LAALFRARIAVSGLFHFGPLHGDDLSLVAVLVALAGYMEIW
jgi:hypothetical protein